MSKAMMSHTGWHRVGLRYQYVIAYNSPQHCETLTVHWGIFTHYFCKLIHGQAGLDKMIVDRVERFKNEVR